MTDGNRIEMEAADALLDVGVSLPLFSFRLPLRRKPVELRVTMGRPHLGGIIRISKLYLTLGHTAAEIRSFGKDEEIAFMAEHGRTLSMMIALTVCRGWLSGLLLSRPLAWLLRWRVPERYMFASMLFFSSMIKTKSFMPIITSAERMNPTRPKVSR